MEVVMKLVSLACILGCVAGTVSANIINVPLDQLPGCFTVTYRFVEDGEHDYGPLSVTESITSRQENDVFILDHYQVRNDGHHKHFSEMWAESNPGAWKQVIVGPGGEFRYECLAPFTFQQRQCTSAGAPKPRRDMNRSDYETLDRESTLQITATGWVQAERNIKRNADGIAVSNEIGWIDYRRIDQSACGATVHN
jgi:hypothetical protein